MFPSSRTIPHRNAVLGLRQYRHALREIYPACRRHHDGRKVQRCRPGALAHGGLSRRLRCTCIGICRKASGAPTRSRASPAAIACSPDPSTRTCFRINATNTALSAIPTRLSADRALRHTRDSIAIARGLNSRDISMWFADGSNYPGTANIRQRKQWFEENLKACHDASVARTAAIGRVQAIRAGLLSHRYRRLGNGAASGACRRAPGKGLVDTGHH